MPSIKQLTIFYDYLNEERTFSEGDTITGSVTLELEKDTKIEKFFIKAKGDANVHWSEKRGDHTYSYNAHDRLFKAKQLFIPETTKDTVVPRGRHDYKFTLQIPQGSMPASFRGIHGKIVYKIVAKLSRSWRMDCTDEKELNFVSKSIPNIGALMSRQVGSAEKAIGLFSSGKVHMDAVVDKKACAPGETITFVAKVKNSSSKDMIPKFSLKQKVVFRAKGSCKYSDNVLCKMAGDLIKSGKEETVNCSMKIPDNLVQSIQVASGIISVEYQLKVYLDISFASDPEVKFPLVIIPASLTSGFHPGTAMGPYPQGAIGGPSNSDFLPPAASIRPYQTPPGQARYGYPAAPGPGNRDFLRYPAQPPPMYASQPPMYPAPPLAIGGGFNNPLPQYPSPYGSPFSSSSSSPMHHPPPTAPILPILNPPPSAPASFQPSPSAPPIFDLPSSMQTMNTNFLSQQDELPPSYMSLFPPSVRGTSPTQSNAKNDK